MIKLARLFENQFDDPAISAEELRQFAEDFAGKAQKHAGNAADANAGAYGTISTAVGAAFDAFDKALSDRGTMLAGLGGDTITKDDAVRLIRTTVRQREGRVRDKLGVGSAGYDEFFPRGLTEVARAGLPQIPVLLDRLIVAAEKYQTQTGADLLAEFQGLQATFDAARKEQVVQKGGVGAARGSVADARAALERELGLGILELAKLHLGRPERAAEFFNQSLLEDPAHSKRDDAAGAVPVK